MWFDLDVKPGCYSTIKWPEEIAENRSFGNANYKDILVCLLCNPGADYRFLARAMDCSYKYVAGMLSTMMKTRLLERESRNKTYSYFVTDKDVESMSLHLSRRSKAVLRQARNEVLQGNSTSKRDPHTGRYESALSSTGCLAA